MVELVDSVDIAVAGDPTRARETAAGALATRGFTLTWPDPWNGVAIKGSRGKQAVLGAFAVYLEVYISVFAMDGATIVRVARPSTGMTGGLAGRAKARNQFSSLVGELTEVFRVNGVLLNPPAAG